MVPDELNVYLWRKRLPPVLPDARARPLARGRHPAAGSCAAATTWPSRTVMPSLRARGGRGAVVQGAALVLDLPHPSPPRRALPRGPLLPARRRRAHPQPGRRAGHEHRPAGRLQPRLEARAGGRGRRATKRCSTPTRPSACRSPSGCWTRPTAPSRSSCPTAGSRGLLRTRVLARMVGVGDAPRAGRSFAFRTISQTGIRYRDEPAVADASRACPTARRAPATASHG